MSDEFVKGFTVREAAWHGKADVLSDYPGREEAIKLAGHDFLVIERPIAIVTEVTQDEGYGHVTGPQKRFREVPGWKSLIRDTDETILNVVRDSYTVVQNDVLWDIVDAIVDQRNVKYETAGVLKGGAVLWVSAYIDEPLQVPGDDSVIVPFLACSTTHDGSGACRADRTNVRRVCMNTHNAALMEAQRTGLEFVFRHTKNVHARIEEAKEVLSGARKSAERFVELATQLGLLEFTEAQRELLVKRFIPSPPETLISDRVAKNVEEARAAVRSILNGPTVPDAHRFTGYGFLEATVEYLDYYRKARSPETRINRTLLRPEPLKRGAVKLIRESAEEFASV